MLSHCICVSEIPGWRGDALGFVSIGRSVKPTNHVHPLPRGALPIRHHKEAVRII